ncbi:disulfide bond formation protein DsbA [Methylorubrum extorquens]|uniref:Disulfide bond formation protein DsbA n=1 Tax=Methylorubrum extorquens TaxID=408 RepID=A0A1S1P944_METEX|nr:disulfide bond formation protein DsbA [Methylorubrum extorquens]
MLRSNRRQMLRLTLGSVATALIIDASAWADDFWYELKGDDGSPVRNTRLPGELAGELASLPGIVWAGARDDALTLFEFYDDNCPYCRGAAKEIDRILHQTPDLRLGLINNAILSPRSVESAKVGLAMLSLKGSSFAYALHQQLMTASGPADGERALQIGVALGVKREMLRQRAESAEVEAMLNRQKQAAANLGLSVTPAFVLGNSGITGYPGPKSLIKILAAGRTCGEPVC